MAAALAALLGACGAPYGLSYTNEVKSNADRVNHGRMVVSIRKDLGM